jgi:phage terminase large subunit GpA-like protein
LNAYELVQSSWNEGLKPPPLSSVWEWADENRMLGGSSSEPGRYRTDRTPYLRDIMDCLSPSSPTREVDLIKGTQVGCTEVAYNWIGFIVDQNPGNVLAVLPDQATAKEWSQQRLSQLTEETECLRNKIKEPRTRDGGNSTFSKKFGSCYLKMAWASSPKKMRSMPAPNIIADEVDGFVRDSGGEGSPIALLRRRATNFPESKFFRGSTPNEHPSLIEQGFLQGDQRYFFLPCPHCGHFQRLVFERLRWDKGEHSTVRYYCIGCEEAIPERFKTQMLARGIWIATKHAPEIKNAGVAAEDLCSIEPVLKSMQSAHHASFHLSALYSPLGWYSWASAAKDWEQAEDSSANRKTFVNTVLGEVWREASDVPDWKRLAERKEDYRIVPMGGLFLTAGADVQKNRIEIQVRAWGERKENWLVDYEVIEGRTADSIVWDKLSDFLGTVYQHESGVDLPITKLAIDSGYETQNVYAWARKQPEQQVIVIKGSDTGVLPVTPPKYLDLNSGGKTIKRGISVRTVNVSILKGELYGWLNQDAPTRQELACGAVYPSGYVHNNAQSDEFFQQLVAEKIVTRVVDYLETFEWVKLRERNEALDTFVYARAAAIVHGLDRARPIDFARIRDSLQGSPKKEPAVPAVAEAPAPEPAAVQTVERSGWIPRRRNWLS